MKLQFSFEGGDSSWSVKNVFNRYYNNFLSSHKNHDVIFLDSSQFYDGNPSNFFSPHIMVIKNLDNEKYMIVSYWDRAIDLTFSSNGWNQENCVELFTSSGVFDDIKYTPISYVPYRTDFEILSKNSKDVLKKEHTELFFRGKLYGEREKLFKTNKIKILSDIIDITEYFNELNSNRISLSLNGAAEICNRDIEILSSKSVLLRLELKQKFYNPLIPNFHYVSYEYNEDPLIQSQIIIDRFNEIKNDIDFLKNVSENGFKWYSENGTIDRNVFILHKLINTEKLI
jgi:hypothetical protein